MGTIVIEAISTSFTVYLSYRAIKALYGEVFLLKTLYCICLLHYAALLCCVFLIQNPTANIATNLGFLFLQSLCYIADWRKDKFVANIMKRIAAVALVFILFAAFEFIATNIYKLFEVHITHEPSIILDESIRVVLLVIVLQIVARFENVKKGYYISPGISALLSLLPISSIILCTAIPNTKNHVDIIIFATVAVINLTTLALYARIGALNYEYTQTQLQLAESKSAQNYTDTIRTYRDEIARILHDLKQQDAIVAEHIRRGELNQALALLVRSAEALPAGDEHVDTGNIDFDIPLDGFMRLARGKGIDPVLHCNGLPATLKVDKETLYCILGNTINNAINATCKLEKQEQSIDIYINYTKGVLVIRVMNTCAALPAENVGRLLHRRNKSPYHGHGLNNIRRAIGGYHGSRMDTCMENGVYTNTVYLPIDPPKN